LGNPCHEHAGGRLRNGTGSPARRGRRSIAKSRPLQPADAVKVAIAIHEVAERCGAAADGGGGPIIPAVDVAAVAERALRARATEEVES